MVPITITCCPQPFLVEAMTSLLKRLVIVSSYLKNLGTHHQHNVPVQMAVRRFSQKDFFETPDDRPFKPLSVENFKEIIKDEKDELLVKSILKEYEVLKYTTFRVPTDISAKDMKELMETRPGSYERRSYYEYLFQKEAAKNQGKRMKDRRREEHLKKVAHLNNYPVGQLFDENNRPLYSKWRNTMFIHVSETTMARNRNWRKKVAAMFGPHLIFDFSYDHLMRKQDIVNLCDQLALCHGMNSHHRDPFNLYFCNLKKDTFSYNQMHKAIPIIKYPSSFMAVEERPPHHVFPKEKLVYLSPHAQQIYNYKSEDIPIIGAFVDKTTSAPESLARAKEAGIRVARLPIDEHVVWGQSSKKMTLNCVFGIMLDIKVTGDWKKAFLTHIPRRKLKSLEEIHEEEERRLRKYKRIMTMKKDDRW